MRKIRLHALNKFLLLMATCFFWHLASAQDQPVITITGTVKDSITNEPVIGAVIAVKGTSKATTTDLDGKYTIEAPSNSTLIISYAGYVEQEIPVNNSGSISINLREDTESLQEIVAVGYGTQEREDVTGAISSVEGRDLAKVVVTDPAQAIQGRATGVTVTQNTGSPGSPISIRVRGVGTIGNSNPLYVVNGIPVGDIGYLNSNDIASIDILKDASSSAVYGSRAANGVILVTTKKGVLNKPRYEFSALTGISQEWRRYNVLNAQQWSVLKNEALAADNQAPAYNPDTMGKGTDWQDQIFKKAIMQSYYLSASGSTEKVNYYVSGSYLKQEGIVRNSNYERFNFSSNVSASLTKRLTLSSYNNVAISNRLVANDGGDYESVISSALSIDPLTPIYSNRGKDSIYAPALGDARNPVAQINTRDNTQSGINFLQGVYADYMLFKDLKFRSSLGYQYSTTTTSDFGQKYYLKAGQGRTVSSVVRDQSINFGVVWENSLAYDKTIGNHHFGALVLYGIQNNRSEYFRTEKTSPASLDKNNQYFDAATDPNAVAEGLATENALVSYLGRVNYTFSDRYLLTANLRRDESSRFPSNNRVGYFPSVAAGWKISEEGFFEPLTSVISFMKIRGGYGLIGNQNLVNGDYPYSTNIYNGQNYSFGDVITPGSAPRSIGNPNITWEKVKNSNIAADFGFFQNKLTVSLDYFQRTTSDMLIRRRVPAIAGLEESPYVNGGKISNKGLEVSAELRKQTGVFNYRVGANITFIKNNVDEIGDPIPDGLFRSNFVNRTQQGGTVAEFYGLQTDGIIQTEEEAASRQSIDPGVRAGDFRFKDLNNDGKISDLDRTFLGSPIPKFTYGFNADASFMNFDIVLLFQGVAGNKIFNGSKYVLESSDMVNNNNKSDVMLERWTGPGTSNEVPRVAILGAEKNARISNYFVEDGSYLRLKTLQIGYTIPEKIISAIKLQRLRIFVGAQNLLTITKYTGLDPEIGANNYSQVRGVRTPSPLDIGIDRGGNYPQARTWQLGINATF